MMPPLLASQPAESGSIWAPCSESAHPSVVNRAGSPVAVVVVATTVMLVLQVSVVWEVVEMEGTGLMALMRYFTPVVVVEVVVMISETVETVDPALWS